MTLDAAAADAFDQVLGTAVPRLMIPGPCQPGEAVMRAFHQPVRAHYGPLWAGLHEQALDLLRQLVGAGSAYLLPGSGTLAIEVAVCSLFRPGQCVVVPDTGYFGRRLAELAQAQGLVVRRIEVEMGRPVTPEQVADRMDGAAGLLTVHVETSTGVRHPVHDLARVVHRSGGLTLVDAVSSLAGEEVLLAEGGIDAIAAGSQKGLGCPPGLGIVALNDRAHVALRTDDRVPWYLDLRRWDRERQESFSWEPHPVTMPSPLVMAVTASLMQITGRGVARWYGERAALAAHCRARFEVLGLTPVPEPGSEATLVTVVHHPDPDRVRTAVLRDAGIAITGGLQPVTRAIRVGLMGAHATTEMVDLLADTLARVL